jgi:hypothetical protein
MIPHPYSDDIKIKSDQLYYSPLNTPMNKLRFEVTNISTDQKLHTSYKWSTNYGYFISFTTTEANQKILGDICETPSNEIYWTYPTEDIVQIKNPVNIKLNVLNLDNNATVANTSLNLTWFTKDIVFVNYSYL